MGGTGRQPCPDVNATQVLIHSPEFILASAIRANKKLRGNRRGSLEDCLALPDILKLGQALGEEVAVWPVPKKSGGFRAICSFGLQHRTRQELVCSMLGVLYKPRPWQFTHKGVPKAIAAIKSRIGSQSLHVASLDIENCFPSFDHKLVNELPLPSEVVEHVALGRHMAVVAKQGTNAGAARLPISLSTDALLLGARRGIPLGSTCSPIVASFVLARLTWILSVVAAAVNYVDDFFLMAPSASALKDQIGELGKAVSDLPGGTFNLRTLRSGPIDEGAEFLGHHFQMIEGHLITSPTQRNHDRFWKRCCMFDTKLPKVHTAATRTIARTILAAQWSFAKHWFEAFSACDRIGEMETGWSLLFEETAEYHGLTLAQIKPYLTPYYGEDEGYVA